MPYKVYEEDGKFCVHKHTGGNKGATVPGGCHPDKAKADAHMRALYSATESEKKELTDAQEEIIFKELEEKGYMEDKYPFVPYGVTNWDQLDSWRASQANIDEIRNNVSDMQGLIMQTLYDSNIGIDEKVSAIKELADGFGQRVKSIATNITEEDADEKETVAPVTRKSLNKSLSDKFKDFIADIKSLIIQEEEVPEPNNMMLWKEADGSWRWMARYSNKFRDRDNPPEIIAEASHKRFVERVDKGIAPYPDLWLYHRKELRWGKATWVGYDDSGFAMALGYVLPGYEALAEAMSKIDPQELRVSHGMPIKSIARDPDDPTVIIEHDTAEISPLPARAAANMLTSFSILNKEETMPIPDEKRKSLIDLGIPGDVLDQIEKLNADVAKEATNAGIESKEADKPAATEPTAETPKTETPPSTVPAPSTSQPVQKEAEPQATPTPSAKEIADAVSAVLNDRLTAINEKFTTIETALSTMQGEIKALKETDEAKVTKAVAHTPAASLSAMLMQSVIGNTATAQDGREALAKSKPAEAPVPDDMPHGNLGVFTVSTIIKESEKPTQPQ